MAERETGCDKRHGSNYRGRLHYLIPVDDSLSITPDDRGTDNTLALNVRRDILPF
jgi:hypothetical protein